MEERMDQMEKRITTSIDNLKEEILSAINSAVTSVGDSSQQSQLDHQSTIQRHRLAVENACPSLPFETTEELVALDVALKDPSLLISVVNKQKNVFKYIFNSKQ